jgi:hypothetical protein
LFGMYQMKPSRPRVARIIPEHQSKDHAEKN